MFLAEFLGDWFNYIIHNYISMRAFLNSCKKHVFFYQIQHKDIQAYI